MIIKLDHYRKSNTRAIVDGYYSQHVSDHAAPERGPAKILYTASRTLPRLPDNRDSVTLPEKS